MILERISHTEIVRKKNLLSLVWRGKIIKSIRGSSLRRDPLSVFVITAGKPGHCPYKSTDRLKKQDFYCTMFYFGAVKVFFYALNIGKEHIHGKTLDETKGRALPPAGK